MRPYTTAPMFGSSRDVLSGRAKHWLVSDVLGNGPDAKTARPVRRRTSPQTDGPTGVEQGSLQESRLIDRPTQSID